jgi:hypothetical protein
LLLPAPFDAEVGIAGRLNIGTERSVFSRTFKLKFIFSFFAYAGKLLEFLKLKAILLEIFKEKISFCPYRNFFAPSVLMTFAPKLISQD